jgi:hypothetical protein
MKTFICFVILMVVVCPVVSAQSITESIITLPRSEMTVEDVLDEIKTQSKFTFTYSNKILLKMKVRFTSTRLDVKQIVDIIKRETEIEWQLRGTKIILRPAVKKHTINGYMRDGQTGENLIGGNIYSVPDLHGTTTNVFGHFSLTLSEGQTQVMASYVGYEAISMFVDLRKDTTIDMLLKSAELREVVIEASSDREPVHEITQMSIISMPVQQLKSVPAMAGEVDIMRSLSLLPGVQSGSEGSTGLYVRGGGPDQNLILLDGVPVYNASHLFGFFSTFNADAINHVDLIKGGFPARYGGRLSSVIDINMKEGNKEKLKGEGSIGLIGSKFTLEGPLRKDKATFIVSARRTYIDVLAQPFLKKSNKIGYYFYDLNAKVNYTLNKKHRVYLSAYNGKDNGYQDSDNHSTDGSGTMHSVEDKANITWGNTAASLRWNYVISPKLFSNVSATYSKYHFTLFNSSNATTTKEGQDPDEQSSARLYSSGISDYTLKADIDYLPSARQYVKTGIYTIHHTFNPGAMNSQSGNEQPVLTKNPVSSIEFGGYAEDDIALTSKLKVNAGLHVSGLHVDQKTFVYPQPRLAIRYLLNSDVSIKASYATMAQYAQLLTNAGVGLPTDLWVPATAKVGPMRARQVATGLAWSPNKTYEFTLEGYYKKMYGVIEYKDGASYLNSQDWQDKVEIGQGESYGSEFMFWKKLGGWTGWVGYTLSWTNRQFDNLNFGKKFPYRYDRRHDIEIVASRPLNKKIDFATTWVYGTGNAISLPVASYGGDYSYPTVLGKPVYNNLLYEGRNGFRLRAYHRLDLSVTFKKATRWGERSWVISIYNVYNRKNPYYVGFKTNDQGYRRIYQYSLFPIIPSITYNFKF